MFRFLERFRRNSVWSIALFVEDGDFSFNHKFSSPRFVLDSKKPRNSGPHVHTYADPFLFPHHGELYLFFEYQAVSEPGKIAAIKTRDLRHFEYVGEILKEPFHLSFPFVFQDGADIYLMPESSVTNELVLYKFEDFPQKLVKLRVLLKGAFRDSSLIKHNGVWYFFTTTGAGLELYYTDDLENGYLVPHRCNPITDDPRYSQCGGSPVTIRGQIFRIAQDISGEYGRNIAILKIKKLSKTEYEEEVVRDDYFDLIHSWNSRGGHHLNIAEFNDKIVIAVDGKQNDLWINKLVALAEYVGFPGTKVSKNGRHG